MSLRSATAALAAARGAGSPRLEPGARAGLHGQLGDRGGPLRRGQVPCRARQVRRGLPQVPCKLQPGAPHRHAAQPGRLLREEPAARERVGALCRGIDARAACGAGRAALVCHLAREGPRAHAEQADRHRPDATGAHPVAGPAGLVVRRDGVAVDAGAYGVAVAVDGGTHTIEASAPGKKPWSSQIALTASADAKTVIVPALEDGPQPLDATQPGATPDAPGAHGIWPPSPRGFRRRGRGSRGARGGHHRRRDGELEGQLGQEGVRPGLELPAQHQSLAASTDMSSAGSLADVSTVAFIAGGALVATGVVLVLVGGPKKSPRPSR